MDSKEEANAGGRRHDMATENSDTVALQKKRARRVSFAEMTSVHFFDRDEESNETPLARNARLGDDSPVQSGFFRQMELNKEFGCEDDGNDNDEDEEEEMQRSFLRPVGSPSPGGSTFGSASSNDEDNFFGPVSANFIRPGRLSDSAASDDNHDVTMDSTAFSMHYRSLARSESGADLKTPTVGPLFFEDKTLTNAGSSTIVVLGKNPIAKSSVPVTEVSGSQNSNDMSIVGEKSNKYDYEKLSPGLAALLAESRNNFLNVSARDGVITSPSPKRKESEVLPSVDLLNNLVNLNDSVRKEAGLINSHNLLNGDECAAHGEFVEANGPNKTLTSGPSPENKSSNALVTVASNGDNHKPNRSPYQSSKKESDIQLVASTSSPVKLQQTLLITPSPANYWRTATPLLEQPGSLLRNETVEHQETETSIQKSISKLEFLENSALSSTFRAKVDSSTVKSLDFFRSPNIDTYFEKSRNISRINFAEDAVTEEELTGAYPSKSDAFSMNHARAGTLNHISGENHPEEHLGQKGGKSPNDMIPKNISGNQSRYAGPAASPSKITWSGNNSLFPSTHSNEDALPTETESFLAETASGEGGKTIVSPKSTSSAGKMFEMKLSASPGLQCFQSKDLLPRSPLKRISDSYKGRDSSPEKNLADINLSNAIANMDAVSKGMNKELSSPLDEANSLKNLIEVNAMDKGEVVICNGKEIYGTIDKFSTPAKENKFQFMRSTNLDKVDITSRDILRIDDNLLPGTESRAVSHGSVSSPTSNNLEDSRLQKRALESPTVSPSKKELGYKESSRIPSPKTTQLRGSANKRNRELLLRDTQHRTEMAITRRSAKLQKTGNCDRETILYPNEGRPTLTGHEKKWTDSYSKFLEDMKRLISRSADRLNHKMIDVLEDVLVHQQRSKIYEMLHLGVMPQNTTVLHDLQLDKIAETKSMLHQLVFENAKLQLKHAKRDRLLKRLQLLNSRIQESQTLKENIASQPLKTCTINVPVDAIGDRSLSVNSKKGHEVCHENLTTMRQSVEALDGKILHLTRTFHACCKMKAEPSCVDTIALVNEHLIKRASFRFLRQDLQMWVVQSVGSMNGQLNVVLGYLDFIVQSTTVTVGPTSSVATSFKLNETNIIKNFPNMDACVAFASVFNAERACKFVGARTLAWETQMTGSLLGTLLDVVEEVQSAQVEFQNLTKSSFCSPSVEQLDLMLCFHNFNSGRKVFLTLDMSCLKRGIYPSETLPAQRASPAGGQKLSSSKQIFDEIRDAVKHIRPGYTRILRLCRCISQVVQSSTS